MRTTDDKQGIFRFPAIPEVVSAHPEHRGLLAHCELKPSRLVKILKYSTIVIAPLLTESPGVDR
jgi:hypothetical protein